MPTKRVAVPTYLSDPTYLAQKAELTNAQKQYQNQQDLERKQYAGQYAQNERRLGFTRGRRDPTIPNSEYGRALDTQSNDFASRGLTFSGENLKARSDIGNYYTTQLNDLVRNKRDFEATQRQAMASYRSQQNAVLQQAKMAAIATIAARYGIDLGQVPRGTSGRTITQEVP